MGLLYNISKDILDIIENAEIINMGTEEEPAWEYIDGETGEVLTDRFEQLNIQKDSLILNMAKEVKNLKAEENALYNEQKAFETRRKQTEHKREFLQDLIKKYAYGTNYKDDEVSIRWRKCPEKVEIANELNLPEEYRRVSWTPDKAKIKQALKNGEDIDGCRLVRGDDNLSIM